MDPRLSGTIEESATNILNGSQADGSSTSSNDDTISVPKRSDEDDDEEGEEENLIPNGAPGVRRPCINFLRPLVLPEHVSLLYMIILAIIVC